MSAGRAQAPAGESLDRGGGSGCAVDSDREVDDFLAGGSTTGLATSRAGGATSNLGSAAPAVVSFNSAGDSDGGDDGADGYGGGGMATTRKHFTLLQLVCLFACSFSYAFIFNSINNIVIPKEIERLASSRQSVWVGLVMAAGALSQIATPVVGAASDRSGTRTAYLVYGAVTTIIGIVLFMTCVSVGDMSVLFLAHVVTSIGLSMQYSMVTALLNDHVIEEQVGKGSGTMAILAIVGSGAGYIMFAAGTPLHYTYLSYMASTLLCLVVCLVTVPAPPPASANAGAAQKLEANATGAPGGTNGGVVPVNNGDSTTSHHHRRRAQHLNLCQRLMSDVTHALSVPSPKRYPDFFFACLGRALFNTGLAGQVYLVYYFRDVLGAENPTQLASIVAVAALVGGVVGALPAGVISDRVGKKPVIYWSIAVCITALISFMLARDTTMLQGIGFIYGVGNVAYLSVDYALGVQSLPRRIGSDGKPRGPPVDAAKDLGVFAMSATAGQLFGQVLYAAVLEQGGAVATTGFVQYGYTGFVGVYAVGCTAFAVSGVATTFIRTVK
jgi:MFS family permease